MENGEPLEDVEECKRGWLRLELRAGTAGHVLSEGHEYNVGSPKNEAYFRRSDVSCYLSTFILDREFENLKFSIKKDIKRLRQWCKNSFLVIGAL